MREILFRGKRVDNGRWVEGQYTCEEYEPHLQKVLHIDRIAIAGACVSVGVIPETVGQYTGLKDKNGTRIFEGDIIKQVIPHNLVQPFIFTVNWCEECAMFVLPRITNDAFDSDFTVMRSDEIEIIGNIHDNGYPF